MTESEMNRETYTLKRLEALSTTVPEADRVILTRIALDHVTLTVEDVSVTDAGQCRRASRILCARLHEARVIVPGLTVTYNGGNEREGVAKLLIEHTSELSVGVCKGSRLGKKGGA